MLGEVIGQPNVRADINWWGLYAEDALTPPDDLPWNAGFMDPYAAPDAEHYDIEIENWEYGGMVEDNTLPYLGG